MNAKHSIVSLIFLIFSFFKVVGQTPNHYVTYTGGDNYIPFNFMYNKVQWLYYPSDLTNVLPLQAGMIEKVYIKASQAVNVTIPNVTIKLGTTTITNVVNGNWNGGMTTVLSANNFNQISTVGQWVVYTLTNPFFYDGVSNLILEVEVSTLNAGGYTVYQGYPGNNRRMYGLVGSATSAGIDGTQAAFGFDIQSNCTGMPLAGSITKNSSNIVCGNVGVATLTNNTSSMGIVKQWQYSYNGTVWNDGDTGSVYTLNNLQQRTLVRCRVTCTNSNMTATTAIDTFFVSQIPFSLGVDSHICLQDTIMLSANLPNQTAVLWSDNSSTYTMKVFQPGTYSGRVTFANGCISRDTIVIRAGVEPINPLAAQYDLCKDSVISLLALNQNMTYLWSTNDTSRILNVRNAGNYNVTITSRDNCVRTYATTVTERPLPIVSLTPQYAICIGEPLVIDGTALHGNSYLWNNGVTNPLLNVLDSGRYTLNVRSSYGCLTSVSSQVDYKDDPTIRGFTFIPGLYANSKTVQFALIDPLSIDRVVWYFGDGDSSTSMNPIHVYDSIRTYLVRVFVTNNCNTNTYEQKIDLKPTSVDNIALDKLIAIYPNPTVNQLIIDNKSGYAIMSISLLDIVGRKLQQYSKVTNSIDVSSLAAGQYVLELQMESGQIVVQKFVKQ